VTVAFEAVVHFFLVVLAVVMVVVAAVVILLRFDFVQVAEVRIYAKYYDLSLSE